MQHGAETYAVPHLPSKTGLPAFLGVLLLVVTIVSQLATLDAENGGWEIEEARKATVVCAIKTNQKIVTSHYY